ncbi:MAG: thioesterase [Phycisphaerae bacterium]|nr:thioesterase [Phycisphaerae bacterium]
MQKDKPREDRFTVEAFDCRPDGCIKPNALMQYLQEAAARHAQQLGVGFADLDRQDCFWVLVNSRIEMTDAPRWGQNVTIRTWPSGFTRLVASREFIGHDADGRELFRAASEWMILDKRSSRPKNLQRLDLHLPQAGPKALSTELRRLRPAEAYTPAYTLSVPFSSLDFNGHVNNTEYVRWAWDGLHRWLGHSPALRSMQVTYTAEVFEGDEIEVLVAADGDAPIRILERRPSGATDANVFLMEIDS